jgi:hypothetical protein
MTVWTQDRESSQLCTDKGRHIFPQISDSGGWSTFFYPSRLPVSITYSAFSSCTATPFYFTTAKPFQGLVTFLVSPSRCSSLARLSVLSELVYHDTPSPAAHAERYVAILPSWFPGFLPSSHFYNVFRPSLGYTFLPLFPRYFFLLSRLCLHGFLCLVLYIFSSATWYRLPKWI